MKNEELYLAGWRQLTPEEQRLAVKEVQKAGRKQAQHESFFRREQEWKDRTRFSSSLYREWLLREWPVRAREWLGPPSLEKIQDYRLVYFLDAYARTQDRLQGLPPVPFSEAEIQRLSDHALINYRTMQEELIDLNVKAQPSRKGKREERARLNESLELVRTITRSLQTEWARAHIHFLAVQHAREYFDCSLEESFAVPMTRTEKQNHALTQLVQALHCEIDLSLTDATLYCLQVGLSMDDPRLLDILLPYQECFEGDDRLQFIHRNELSYLQEPADVQEDEIPLLAADPETDEDGAGLEPELQRKLQDLLPLTRGKRAVIVGGWAREEHRKRIEQTFQFSEVVWPVVRDNENFDKVLNAVRSSEFVWVLNKWCRRRKSRAFAICDEHGIPVIKLKAGINIRQVISNAHSWLYRVPERQELTGATS